MRSLQVFTPDLLIEEAQDGQDLAAALENARSESFVTCSSLGPKTDEQEAMQIVPAGQRRHCASDHRVCITRLDHPGAWRK